MFSDIDLRDFNYINSLTLDKDYDSISRYLRDLGFTPTPESSTDDYVII